MKESLIVGSALISSTGHLSQSAYGTDLLWGTDTAASTQVAQALSYVSGKRIFCQLMQLNVAIWNQILFLPSPQISYVTLSKSFKPGGLQSFHFLGWMSGMGPLMTRSSQWIHLLLPARYRKYSASSGICTTCGAHPGQPRTMLHRVPIPVDSAPHVQYTPQTTRMGTACGTI